MKSLLGLAAGLLAFAATEARAATFDDATGTLRLSGESIFTQSFDSRESLGKLPVRLLDVSRAKGYAQYTDSGAALDASAFTHDALEGTGALRVAGDRALLVGDADSLAALSSGRVEIRLFARADGAMPELRVLYSRKPLADADVGFPTAQVVTLRTGRATSDGWIELSTGPIDGNALGLVVSGLLFTTPAAGPKGASFVVDALEVSRIGAETLSGGDCSLAQATTQCKKGASCIEGYCFDGALVYGALPPKETRKDIVARTATYLTRFEEDRNGAANAASGFAAKMPAVAETADTPEAFFRAFATSFAEARGAHTSAPIATHYSRVASGSSTLMRYRGSELNACFGLVDKDWLGGGRAFGVFSTLAPSPLKVGDVIEAVDGEPIDAWNARVLPEHGILSADPDSDRAYAASMLHAMIMRYGRTLTVKRCSMASDCQTVSVDLVALRKTPETIKPLTCTPRFQLAVPVPQGVDSNAYEAAIMNQTPDGIVALHTNGEPLDDASWVATVTRAFETAQSTMIIDKRRGDGGGGRASQTWGKYLRRDPSVGLFFVGRIDHDLVDGPTGFLADLLGTCDGLTMRGKCAHAQLETYPIAAGSLPPKVAWLNTLDGSASDMATFFAKGASGVRVFAPSRTMGLFGGYGVMAGFLPGWSGGSVQIGDVREGHTNQERLDGKWHSGRGVEPDEVVVQLQSDLVQNRDTILERARAWLLAP